jgi:DEAD/DEAH box helicase domain-containing protein
MTPTAFLTSLKSEKSFRHQLIHIEHLSAKAAEYGKLARPLDRDLAKALRARGIERLYSHQAHTINVVLEKRDVVIATGTASGKTLCYNIPVIQAALADPNARALYLFPTRALAQDQLRSLDELTSALGKNRISFGTYDSDTGRAGRTKLRKSAEIILTNPDMLSVGILPNHSLWRDFFSNLRYVVIDEAHIYRGVFGSQVACVIRRLRRICRFYGCKPQFICCSATVANPGEHVARLTGRKTQVVMEDGAPRGPKEFALWNPPFIDPAKTTRRSANSEAASLFAALVHDGFRTITFARARKTAELILLYTRDILKKTDPKLVDRIRAYRAGYLVDERRDIERQLFNGHLHGVTATNALELGIDVGHLDASVIVGFPGTIASLWQQAGRSGRTAREALSILIGTDDPLNQFFMSHPRALFEKSIEHALIYPDNPYILEKQLPCAAFELPLTSDDEKLFGPGFVNAMIELERAGTLKYQNERWYFAKIGYPAEQAGLRSISDRSISLVNEKSGELIEEIDGSNAMSRVHQGAVYLHQAETFLVTRIDLKTGAAFLKPIDADYYTEAREISETRVIHSLVQRQVGTTLAHFGNVRVIQHVVGFRRKRQFSDESLEEVDLDYPPESYETKGVWWDIPDRVASSLKRAGCDLAGALHASEHACIGLLPLFAMCDRWDIGGLSTLAHVDTGRPQIFIYDGFPGGIGIAEKGYALLEQLFRATLETIEKCPCEYGCPSCIQSPKCGNNNQPLDKRGAEILLRELLKVQ